MNDPINPEHYKERDPEDDEDIECIDWIRRKLTPDQFYGFCMGNVLKYEYRAGLKDGNPYSQDIRKGQWYLRWTEGIDPRTGEAVE